jgi:hypothetical protein
MTIPDMRGSAETCSSSDTTHPGTQVNSIHRTVKSEESEDTSTISQTTSLDSADKKQPGNKILKKLFSNLTKGNKMEVVDEEVYPQRSLIDLVPTAPVPYLNPLEHKLVPRLEPGLRKNGFSFAAAYAPAPAPPIMLRASVYRNSMYEIAKNRANTARILNGEEFIDLDTEDEEQIQHGAKSERDLNEDEVDQIIKTLIREHSEQVVASSAKDEKEKPAWRKWIKEYRKASLYDGDQSQLIRTFHKRHLLTSAVPIPC